MPARTGTGLWFSNPLKAVAAQRILALASGGPSLALLVRAPWRRHAKDACIEGCGCKSDVALPFRLRRWWRKNGPYPTAAPAAYVGLGQLGQLELELMQT